MRQSRDGVTQILEAPRADGGAESDGWARLSWTVLLIWWMRTLAWVWVAKGLFNWSIVLGINPNFPNFTMLPKPLEATIVFFAAVDLLAAVGLWLAAPWGGVLWLLCAVIEAVSPILGARGAFVGAVAVGLNLALIAIYFVLNWRARRERD
jgi:uncharacterized membrane protein YphA (DoxX/SURF4 family)